MNVRVTRVAILAIVGICLVVVPLFATGESEDSGTTVLSTYLQIDPANPQYEGHNKVMESYLELPEQQPTYGFTL